jgi:type IV pilus assembly protein PilV
VLIALFILLIGLVGLAGLQARAQQAENESYQRLQALMLLRDMADRINANRANAATYVTASPVGYANLPAFCTAPAGMAQADLCQWSAALTGAAETSGGTCDTSSGANCVGAMIRARGCVDNLGGGATGPFLVTIVWQGLVSSAAPPASVSCGSGNYGTESLGFRRAVTTVVQIANLS